MAPAPRRDLDLRAFSTHLSGAIKVLFASGSGAVIANTVERFRTLLPDLPLVVVAEFAPPEGEWIPWHVKRTWRENRAWIRSKIAGRKIRLAAVILEPRTPYWGLRTLGFSLAPLYFLAYNENGEHFMLRPRSVPSIFRHVLWRLKNFVKWQLNPGGWIYTQVWRIGHPREFRRPIYYRLALLRGKMEGRGQIYHGSHEGAPAPAKPAGISVVIPSRNGRELLDRCLPRIYDASEIIVVDNGSNDGTADALRADFPSVTIESSAEPLSFARAVNRGIRRARFSHVCVLNNDMLAEPGFLAALGDAFEKVPGMFAATAQIFFPEGRRREETGKTVIPSKRGLTDFPIRCDDPLDGEDLSYVLYGSGGCTLYDAAKLAELGAFDEIYDPAYVEDLDLGVRAWERGWPSVYCAGARVLHLHRSTTSRYFTQAQLHSFVEHNYIRFLSRAIADRATFRRMWRENVVRLNLLKEVDALVFASQQESVAHTQSPMTFLDLTNGDVSVFPGRAPSGKPRVLIASPYVPFPLAHGAAVRIYNLMRRAARDFDQVLVAFTEDPRAIPAELLEICVEVVTVRRAGSHALPSTPRPETVEEFDFASFHAALRQTLEKWRPSIAQLEFTQMAQYAADCAPARTILVEHDITYDLFAQMLAQSEDWETRRQYERWLAFERESWNTVDRVVVMSDHDRALVPGSVTIANGVDIDRFQPSTEAPEPRHLLFIGSFAHRPNVLALDFFLRDVWQRLHSVTLHVIAGLRHQRFWDLEHPGVEVEGFVSDVRPAYRRATLVIAPLVASAGTNIKILEAMAMGKAIVSTEAGIHGLDLARGEDVVVTHSGAEMADAITLLLDRPEQRIAIEQHARRTAEQSYSWDAIALRQAELYRDLQTPKNPR
jgi:GT2 family glycosyltransferase/glycosyltransferase involved in cell wall biosynthesis